MKSKNEWRIISMVRCFFVLKLDEKVQKKT